jgi:hypothetical protein
MIKNSLRKNGLSMSQASSISNLCNQRAMEIDNILSNVNNAKKTITLEGKERTETAGKPLPSDVVEKITTKANLYATQGFLVENIKAKDAMIKEIKSERFVYDVEAPERPKAETAEVKEEVGESWAKAQLSIAEINEWIAVEAQAAHIGQFIHRDSILDRLRKELPTIKTLEWIHVKDGERTPLDVTTHHTPEQLLEVHEKLAAMHRMAEQRVNYFKAKVKNLVTTENGNIARYNADEENRVNTLNKNANEEYFVRYQEWSGNRRKAEQEFTEKRNERLKEVVAFRIEVPELFKPLVDEFLAQLGEEE